MSLLNNAIGLGGVLPTTALTSAIYSKGSGYYIAMKTILDLFFRDWCVFMQQPSLIGVGGKSVVGASLSSFVNKALDFTGVPLIGFTFRQPSNFEILKYEYTKYPFIDRSVIANNMLKQTTTITLTGLRPITGGNSVLMNYIMNTIGLNTYIEKYCDAGGLLMIHTMWGSRRNYALKELKGVKPSGEVGGVGWEFTFERLNFSDMDTSVSANDARTSLLEA